MGLLTQITISLKALKQLGLQQVGDYAMYRAQLYSTYLARRTKAGLKAADLPPEVYRLYPFLPLPDRQLLQDLLGSAGRTELLKQADETLAGVVRLFGGELVPLDMGPASSEHDWTDLERGVGQAAVGDVKLVWEMGRFGWAVILGRAYWITGDESYPQAFWEHLEAFLRANPPYYGYHWVSAQEAALRLIALSFAAQVFDGSVHSTAERISWLGRTLAVHAGRIPPSMSYARAQGNNHLLVEAAGLYTAGTVLRSHPEASRWRRTGWSWVNKALQGQIASDGSYVQQSTNYHRLMLQAALWVQTLAGGQGDSYPEATRQRLAAASQWLYAILDSQSGRVPNLGPNDGALILPLSLCQIHDYRPVLQAASRVFLGGTRFEPGLWDEMGLWHTGQYDPSWIEDEQARTFTTNSWKKTCQPLILRSRESWAYLRAAHFRHRPGHADQLHLDLWWRGLNIAQDAGTYLYNAGPPWDNALAGTLVHNTVTLNGRHQMTRAGRFLWLDWAQASQIIYQEAADVTWKRAAAEHDGYRRMGVTHRRQVTTYLDDRWLVEDSLRLARSSNGRRRLPYRARLHWLLPDWSWGLAEDNATTELSLESPYGTLSLQLGWSGGQDAVPSASLQLVRAGELLAGSGAVPPICGWYSPTYGSKIPALSLSLTVESLLPIAFRSEWKFPPRDLP